MKKFLLLFLISCYPEPKPTPIVVDNYLCAAAETHLKELKCIGEGSYTKKGKSFTIFCLETQQNGIFLNPKCLTEINSCEQIDSCTR